jgi:hypothetical protein
MVLALTSEALAQMVAMVVEVVVVEVVVVEVVVVEVVVVEVVVVEVVVVEVVVVEVVEVVMVVVEMVVMHEQVVLMTFLRRLFAAVEHVVLVISMEVAELLLRVLLWATMLRVHLESGILMLGLVLVEYVFAWEAVPLSSKKAQRQHSLHSLMSPGWKDMFV